MANLPAHIVTQIQRLSDEGKPVAEIAFMLRLSETAVDRALTDAKERQLNRQGNPTPAAMR